MFYRPTFIIPKRASTDKFWKRTLKLRLEERTSELISDLVLNICERRTSEGISVPKISKIDDVRRIRVGKYRPFYKVDRRRGWFVFFDIEKRSEHTYRHDRVFKNKDPLR